MGLFGSIGNILGKATGVRIQPFKGKVNFKTPGQGLNFGDLLSATSLLAPGGNLLGLSSLKQLGLKNLTGNLGLQSILKNGGSLGDWSKLLSGGATNNPFAMLSGLGGLGGQSSTGSSGLAGLNSQTAATAATNSYADLIKAMYPGAKDEAAGLAQFSKDRALLGRQAAQRLSPGAVQSQIDRQRANLASGANRTANQTIARMGSAGAGLQEGIRLNAANNAQIEGNRIASQAFDPAAIAQRDAQRLQMLDPMNYAGVLNMTMGGLGNLIGLDNANQALRSQLLSAAQLRKANAPPSLFESLLGNSGNLMNIYDWIKSMQGGSKGAPVYTG